MKWSVIRTSLILASKGWFLTYLNSSLQYVSRGYRFSVPNIFKLGCLVENYEKMYHVYNYRGKKCLDIGGFSGDSMILFFMWGASKVTVYEPVPEKR